MEDFDYWKFIAGLGFFLYGMHRLEDALRVIAGRKFKLFLRKYTSNRFFAILYGIVATVFLQGSSVVMLMVIAFVGAGIITLSHSLGIILGANLGTTFTGWIVRALGFNSNLESVIYPLIGVGSLGLIFVSKRFLFYHFFAFLTAVGLLFMGLGFMKDSMVDLSKVLDLAALNALGNWAYLPVGFVITAILHSSSAMMTIALSALYSNIITLPAAIYLIIGADLGTTMTAVIGSANGSSTKRRVGLAHFLINVVTALMAVVLAEPIIASLRFLFEMTDPMYLLVAFHSTFNALGILLFVPFLNSFEKLLNLFFVREVGRVCSFIPKVGTEVPEASLEAIRLELRQFAKKTFDFNSRMLGFSERRTEDTNSPFLKMLLTSDDMTQEYEDIKSIEVELLSYISDLQREQLEASESELLNQYILALRSGVQSAKAAKDIQHNLREFRQSVSRETETLMVEITKVYLPVQEGIYQLWHISNKQHLFEQIVSVVTSNEDAYKNLNKWIYSVSPNNGAGSYQTSTFLNVNREIYNSNRYLVDSLRDILLSPKAAQDVSSLPKSLAH